MQRVPPAAIAEAMRQPGMSTSMAMTQSNRPPRAVPSAPPGQGFRPPPVHHAHGRHVPRHHPKGRLNGATAPVIPRGLVRQRQPQPPRPLIATPRNAIATPPTNQSLLEAVLAAVHSSQSAVERASASTAAAEAAFLVTNASQDPASESPSVSLAAQIAAHNALAAAERTAATIQHLHAQCQQQQAATALTLPSPALSHASLASTPTDATPPPPQVTNGLTLQSKTRNALPIKLPSSIALEVPPNTLQLLLDLASSTSSSSSTSHIPLPPLIPTISTSDSPPDPASHLGAAPNKVRIAHLTQFILADQLKSLVLSTSSPPPTSCAHIWIHHEHSTHTCSAVFYFNLYPDACQFLQSVQSLIESGEIKSVVGDPHLGFEFKASMDVTAADPRLARLDAIGHPAGLLRSPNHIVPKLAPTMSRRQKGVNLTLPPGIAQRAVGVFNRTMSKEAMVKEVDLVGGEHDDDEQSLSPRVQVSLSSLSSDEDAEVEEGEICEEVEVWAVHKGTGRVDEMAVLTLDSEDVEE